MVTRLEKFFLIVLLALAWSLEGGGTIFESLVWGKQATAAGASPKERISLDLRGADIGELFKTLSLKSGLAIIPSKEVTGRVNMFLNNVTAEDALDIILVSQGLAYEKKNNIITVMTANEYEKLYGRRFNERRESRSLKLIYAKPANILGVLNEIKSDVGKVVIDESSGTIVLVDTPQQLNLMEEVVKKLDQPLSTLVVELNYANSTDVQEYLSTLVTPDVGTVIADERTNKIIVSDFSERIKKIKRLVSALDEESKQVAIEAEIIQVTLKDEYQQGINWERVFNPDNLDLKATFPSSASFTPSVSLSNSNLQLNVGTVSADDYNVLLQLLETFGNTRIVSRPRLVTLNNKEGKILVGERRPYATQSLSQAQTTTVTSETIEFIDVGVKLKVTPTIGKDGFITMKIKPEVSSVSDFVTTASNSTIPIVETSELETVVKIKDGTMIVIGGLIKEEKRKDVSSLPSLKRLPLLGWLWSSKAKKKQRTELVIFLIPHIMSGAREISQGKVTKIKEKESSRGEIWRKLKGLKE